MSSGAGPSGFAHAPVTKALLVATTGSYVINHISRTHHRRIPAALAATLQAFNFRTPSELLFACLLLYQFRIFERQSGSGKFASRAVAVTGLAFLLQLTLGRLLRWQAPVPPLALPLVFSSFIPWAIDIPASTQFSVLGLPLSDKVFVHLAGLQLLLAGGRRAAVMAGLAGLAACVIRADVAGLAHFRLPATLVSLVTRVLGPLLSDMRRGPTVFLAGRSPQQTAAAAAALAASGGGAQAGPGGAGRSRGRPGGASGSAGGSGAATAAAAAAAAAAAEVSPEAVEALLAMGFEERQARAALQQCDNNVEQAIALLVQ